MKAILRHVLESGIRREVTLFWGARYASDLYEDGWLRELAAREPGFHYVPVLSDEDPAADGRRGLVHEAVLAAGLPLAPLDIYLAGPPEMVAALREALPRHGADPARIVFDSFEVSPDALARLARPSPQA
jgi:CDP-4-dehydro-6-deoxyglucose reductase